MRLIDGDALIAWIKESQHQTSKMRNVICKIESMPSADRPQGEWIEHEHGFWTFVNDRGERDGWLPDYECNLCGSRAWRYASNFCPNCGARMKGADDETTTV